MKRILQAKAILEAAHAKRRGDFCTLSTGCQRCSGGWLDTKELHAICFNPTARLSNLRQAGWDIVCIPQADGVNLFHFVSKKAVEQALPIEKLAYVGLAPGGAEVYEVVRP